MRRTTQALVLNLEQVIHVAEDFVLLLQLALLRFALARSVPGYMGLFRIRLVFDAQIRL